MAKIRHGECPAEKNTGVTGFASKQKQYLQTQSTSRRVKYLQKLCRQKKTDFVALQRAAFNRGGYCTRELRAVIWPILLGLPSSYICTIGVWNHCVMKPHPEAVHTLDTNWRKDGDDLDALQKNQIEKDVNRSMIHWDCHNEFNDRKRALMRLHLSSVLKSIIGRHCKAIMYTQGFDDVCSVFLEIFGSASNVAFFTIERFSLFYVVDYLGVSFDNSISQV